MRLAVLLLALAACTEHGKSPDGGVGGPDGPGKFEPADAFGIACDDDSAFEPNDTVQTAFVTPVDGTRHQISFTGLSICTPTDVDVYRVTLSVPSDLEAVTQLRQGAAPNVAILNAAGTGIVIGTGDLSSMRAFATMLPAGTFFVRVAGNEGREANYALTITATPR